MVDGPFEVVGMLLAFVLGFAVWLAMPAIEARAGQHSDKVLLAVFAVFAMEILVWAGQIWKPFINGGFTAYSIAYRTPFGGPR